MNEKCIISQEATWIATSRIFFAIVVSNACFALLRSHSRNLVKLSHSGNYGFLLAFLVGLTSLYSCAYSIRFERAQSHSAMKKKMICSQIIKSEWKLQITLFRLKDRFFDDGTHCMISIWTRAMFWLAFTISRNCNEISSITALRYEIWKWLRIEPRKKLQIQWTISWRFRGFRQRKICKFQWICFPRI